jgi:hypothetical protein
VAISRTFRVFSFLNRTSTEQAIAEISSRQHPMQLRHVHIEVPASETVRGSSRKLLAILATPEDVTYDADATFDEVMVYLHGFPDMGVHPTKVAFASRVPAKLAEFWINEQRGEKKVAFLTFNFGGVPGSDGELRFTDKTISLEVEDMVFVCKYIRSRLLGGEGKITVIAGLLDMTKGVHFDFNKLQLEQSEAQGWCWKEFYLEDGCPLPKSVELSLDGAHPTTELTQENAPTKIYVKLDQRYINEYYDGSLDIQKAVSRSGLPPLLVIHGDADTDVPYPNGEELFAAAAEPKTFMAIPKANHMLSNSKHLKKALRAIGEHVGAAQ